MCHALVNVDIIYMQEKNDCTCGTFQPKKKVIEALRVSQVALRDSVEVSGSQHGCRVKSRSIAVGQC
jgi:hypothetical protein